MEFNPLAIELVDRGVLLDYELLIANPGPGRFEAGRLTVAVVSTSPDQDRLLDAFHFSPPMAPAGPPFDLDAGKVGRLPGRLALAREQIHVVEVGGRPMFVPLVAIDFRWRAGLSIRRHGVDFMIGTAGQGAAQGAGQGGRIGPIWLDRGAVRLTALASSRYFRKSAVQAAE